MEIRACLAALLVSATVVWAEDLETAVDGYVNELDTVVVTSTRTETKKFDAPGSADVVPGEVLQRRSYRTTPQVLRDIPGILVQETAAGQGSPFIRGFTGFRNVFLIDGIRLNNSVFRSGPNQYWNTIDPWSVERYEVVKGPSSVLYGSDAIGGTVQAFTRSPYGFGGRAGYRGSSAEMSHVGRAEFSYEHGRTAVLVGLTGKTYGDLRAGGDVGTQTNVGYDEWDGDIKIEHFLDDDTRLVLAYQHVRQNNVPRTHRTVDSVSFHGTTVGSELRRDLDQERYLIYAQFHKENIGGFIDAVHASLSWHAQEETRDRLRTGDRRDLQGFRVGTLGAWVQLESPTGIGRLTYGIEVYHDEVDSFSTSNPVQGPVADDATYDLIGLYIQDVIDVSEKLVLTLGVRVNHAAADADRVSDPVTGDPISIDEDWTAVVGSIRFLFRLDPDKWNLFGGVSQGFRAPNLSDLTRFTTARSNEFEIPAPDLDAEHYLSFELGARGRHEQYAVEIATFYTDITDQIIRFPTGEANGDGDFEITKDNVGDGYIFGIEAGASVRVRGGWTIFGNITWHRGRVDTFPTSDQVKTREYISRLMPLSAQVGARWEEESGRFWFEFQVLLADKADRLSTRDAGDTDRIPPGGTPGYGVLHLRGGYMVTENAHIVVAIENVFDKAYRVHGSGITMPGLNAIVSFTLDF